MELLTIDIAYTISLTILIISTIVSRFELASVSYLYIDFVYPNMGIKFKELKWKTLNHSITILSFFSGVFFFFNEILLFKLVFLLTTMALIYSYSIRKIGIHSSDQIRVLAYLSFTLCLLIDNEIGKIITIGSLGAQTLIAYTSSGLAKVFSKQWRKENVLANILGTSSYGIPNLALYLKKHPRLEKFLSHLALVTILSVPVCFFIPYQTPLLIALGCMFLFHFSTAILMGSNDFFITFPLTYPGVLILHSLMFNYLAL